MSSESSDPKFKDCVVAFIDILGSSKILKSDDMTLSMKFVDNMQGFYDEIKEQFSEFYVKTFSDNVLVFTDDCSREGITSIISAVGYLQYDVLCKYGLMVRGGITMGKLYWSEGADGNGTGDFVIGRALVDSYELESKKSIYSRIVLDDSIGKKLEYKCEWVVWKGDIPFVDYLFTAMTESFVNEGMIEDHANVLKNHVLESTKDKKIPNAEWDRIRSKDEWSLVYHNYYCSEHDVSKKIEFTEEYDPENNRAVIKLCGGD